MKEGKVTPQHAQCQLERHDISDEMLLRSTAGERRKIAEDYGIQPEALAAHYGEIVHIENKKRRLSELNVDDGDHMVNLMFWEE